MIFLIIPIVVFALYIRTIDNYLIIDDYVDRPGYYNVGYIKTPPAIYTMKMNPWSRIMFIAMHCLNCYIIYLLWGIAPAFLYAIHPMCVWLVAWKTGNYYGTTAFFTLVTYYIIHTFPNIWGVLAALPIYNAAINSTGDALSFPFLAIFEPWLAPLFIMLFWFFKSDRWAECMVERQKLYQNPAKKDWKRIFLMTKLVARYIYDVIIPIKTCMFIEWGDTPRDDKEDYDDLHACNGLFWASLALCLSIFIFGMMVNPFMTFWFFILIGIHSQFNLTGQLYAQRYLCIAMIGLIVVITQTWQHFGSPLWIAIPWICYLLYKTNDFIPAFKNMMSFMKNDVRWNPNYDMSYNNLAAHLVAVGRPDAETEPLFLKALDVKFSSWQTHFNLAKLYIMQYRLEEALEHAEFAIKYAKGPNTKDVMTKVSKSIRERIELDEKEKNQISI